MTLSRGLWLALCALLLNACATVGEERYDANLKKAAEYNAQLGTTYMQRGDLELAKQKLDKALEQDVNNGSANSGYALLMARLGKHQEAEKYFQRALELAPANSEVLNNYGIYLCEQGQYQAAQQKFQQAAENRLYKTPEYAYTNAGTCAMRTGDMVQAEAFFQSALQANPRFPSALLSMAEYNYRQNNYRRAENYLTQYHDLSRETPQSLLLGARIYGAMGDRDRAGSYMLKLKRLYPDSPLIKEIER